MKLFVAYSTTEGQTRRIARELTGHLVERGHTCELAPLLDAEDIDLGRFDGAILAASVHVNAYQHVLTGFASRHAQRLNAMPTLFVSVSLTAVGHDAEGWQGLEEIAADLAQATGWTPGRTIQVAGAYKPSQYDVLRGFLMRRIMASHDKSIDLGSDREFTDWPALFADVDEWLLSIGGADVHRVAGDAARRPSP